jgi:hypothetical protein
VLSTHICYKQEQPGRGCDPESLPTIGHELKDCSEADVMVVIGNCVVFLLSLLLFSITLPEAKVPFELSLYRDQIMAALVGVSGVLFGFSVWRATVERRTSRATEYRSEIEDLRKALKQAEARRQDPSAHRMSEAES